MNAKRITRNTATVATLTIMASTMLATTSMASTADIPTDNGLAHSAQTDVRTETSSAPTARKGSRKTPVVKVVTKRTKKVIVVKKAKGKRAKVRSSAGNFAFQLRKGRGERAVPSSTFRIRVNVGSGWVAVGPQKKKSTNNGNGSANNGNGVPSAPGNGGTQLPPGSEWGDTPPNYGPKPSRLSATEFSDEVVYRLNQHRASGFTCPGNIYMPPVPPLTRTASLDNEAAAILLGESFEDSFSNNVRLGWYPHFHAGFITEDPYGRCIVLMSAATTRIGSATEHYTGELNRLNATIYN